MAGLVAYQGPPTLLGTTVRRSIIVGRIFLLIGIGYELVLGTVTALASGSSFETSVPVFLPVFGVVGAMGGMMVFTNDRLKGVFEYLIAYGISPRRLFANVLVASLVLATIVLGTFLVVGLGVFLGTGHRVSAYFVELLAVYSLPMTYASVAFAATVGMFWTSLSSPRAGMTSSVGLVPILGIAPSLVTLVVVGVHPDLALYIVIGAVVVLGVVVLLLLSLMERLMPLERLLSPA